MVNILFTCACGKNSEKLFKLINNNIPKINLIGCDEKNNYSGRYLNKFYNIKFKNPKNFINKIYNVSKKNNVKYIIAWADREILALSKNKKKFLKIKTKILLNNFRLIKIFNDKYLTLNLIKKNKIKTPKYEIVKKKNYFDILKKFEFPKKSVIIKTRHGIGGRGIFLLSGSDAKKFNWFKKNNREKVVKRFNYKFLKKIMVPNKSIIMEALNIPAYDADSISINNKVSVIVRKRKNPAGIPYKGSKVVKNKSIVNQVMKIMKKEKLKYILDFDFMTKPESKEPMIIEINPRPSGSLVDVDKKNKHLIIKFFKSLS